MHFLCWLTCSPQTDVVGLLPQEEAAIRRALYESLLEDKKKTPPKAVKQESSLEAGSSFHPTTSLPPLDIAHHSGSFVFKPTEPSPSASQWTGVEPRDQETEGSLEADNSETGSKSLPKRRRLHSPLSPSQSFDSSNGSKPSSPTPLRGLSRVSPSSPLSSPVSVESSLKLVLSTSSWSRSSSSSWSPSPEPGHDKASVKVYLQPKTKAKILRVIKTGKGKAEPKAKRSVGRPRKYPLAPQFKKSPKKSSPGSKKSIMPKIPRTYTKSALKLNKQLSATLKSRGKQPASKRVYNRQKNRLAHTISKSEPNTDKDASPMSPEMALVMHDHCYSSSSSSHQDMVPGGKASSESSPSKKPHPNSTRCDLYSNNIKCSFCQLYRLALVWWP